MAQILNNAVFKSFLITVFFTIGQSLSYGQFTTVLDAPPIIIGDHESIDSDTQLNVSEGGQVGTVFRAGAEDGSSTNVEVNVSGGNIDRNFIANPGSTVNISGGSFSVNYSARANSVTNISGGSLLGFFAAGPGSTVNVTGGSVGRVFQILPGATSTLTGGDFLLNGEVPTGLSSITLENTDVLTGSLADGSVFAFSPQSDDNINDLQLIEVQVPSIDTTPIIIDFLSGRLPPNGLRKGQSLTLRSGALPDNFTIVGATLDINGGFVGEGLKVVSSTVNMTDGRVNGFIYALAGSELNISGGESLSFFDARSDSRINISGGSLGALRAHEDSKVSISEGEFQWINAFGESSVSISGGFFRDQVFFGDSTHITISGGNFNTGVAAFENTRINLIGSEFFLDGVKISDLETGQRRLITERDLTLSGTLADGSEFSFDLNSENDPDISFEDRFEVSATLTIKLVPEPSSSVLFMIAIVVVGSIRNLDLFMFWQ